MVHTRCTVCTQSKNVLASPYICTVCMVHVHYSSQSRHYSRLECMAWRHKGIPDVKDVTVKRRAIWVWRWLDECATYVSLDLNWQVCLPSTVYHTDPRPKINVKKTTKSKPISTRNPVTNVVRELHSPDGTISVVYMSLPPCKQYCRDRGFRGSLGLISHADQQ